MEEQLKALGRSRRRRYLSESIIKVGLLACATVSIFTTVGIVSVLLFEAILFFQEVSVWEFLGSTKWTPLFASKHFGIWALISGTLLTSVGAMFIALPLGLLSAIYLAEYAPDRVRRIVKPVLEVLAGIPTVVYGYFALLFVTPILRGLSDEVSVFNAMSASIVMGIMILPMVSSLSEDAMQSVPRSLREGAYALGATKVEVSTRVVVPGALSGIVAAFILAMSRAVGETMIVFIAAGQNDKLTFNPLGPVNTMTGFMATTNFSDNAIPGTAQFQALFAVGITLFVLTLLMNLLSQFVVARFREVYE
jgi:phosphate transport system permease protein